MNKYLKLAIKGIATGSLILTFVNIFLIYFGGEWITTILIENFIPYSIASMIIGAGFSIPSAIYDNENLSLKTKFLMHMGIGMTIYIFISIYVGWISYISRFRSDFFGTVIALLFALLMAGFYLYNKKEASIINEQIKKIQKGS